MENYISRSYRKYDEIIMPYDDEIHDGHRFRLRQRLIYEGVDALKEHELIEFLLCYVIPRQDVNAIAHALMEHFGDIRKVFTADAESLRQVKGLGEAAIEWIMTFGEFTAACSELQYRDGFILDTYGKMRSFARLMADERKEPCCMLLMMDRRGRLLYRQWLAAMPEWGRKKELQMAIRQTIALNAVSVSMVITAGRRVSYPSNYDRDKARELTRNLSSVGIFLADVLICGSTGITSLRRLGMLPEQMNLIGRNPLRESYLASIPDFRKRPVRAAKLKKGFYRFYCKPGGNYECTEPV